MRLDKDATTQIECLTWTVFFVNLIPQAPWHGTSRTKRASLFWAMMSRGWKVPDCIKCLQWIPQNLSTSDLMLTSFICFPGVSRSVFTITLTYYTQSLKIRTLTIMWRQTKSEWYSEVVFPSHDACCHWLAESWHQPAATGDGWPGGAGLEQ